MLCVQVAELLEHDKQREGQVRDMELQLAKQRQEMSSLLVKITDAETESIRLRTKVCGIETEVHTASHSFSLICVLGTGEDGFERVGANCRRS